MYEKPSCKVLSTLPVWFGNNPRACLGQFLPTTTAQRSAPGRECPPDLASPGLAGTRAHNLLPLGQDCWDQGFVGREPGWLDYIAGTWKIPDIPAVQHI